MITLCRCGQEFRSDGIAFCPTCQPYRPYPAGKVMTTTAGDGSKYQGLNISQKHMEEIYKRKYKRSEKAMVEDGDIK